MQRIFKHDDMHNNTLTPDKELNILMYETPSYVITYRSYKLLNMVQLSIRPSVTLVICVKTAECILLEFWNESYCRPILHIDEGDQILKTIISHYFYLPITLVSSIFHCRLLSSHYWSVICTVGLQLLMTLSVRLSFQARQS